jgi:hypothetical protein
MLSYTVEVYHPKYLILFPNGRVDESSRFFPSDDVLGKIDRMWENRKPREVGFVSELVAKEVIDGSQMEIDGTRWPVSCESFETFVALNKLSLKPEFGIRSDDLISTVAIEKGHRLIFVTECKGTTQKKGFSHGIEAKIFYQLPRTVKVLKAQLAESKEMSYGGTIAFQINHYARAILINLLDKNSDLGNTIPDPWMYKDAGSRGKIKFYRAKIVG